MSGDSQGDQAAEEEPNLYLVTLQQCRDSLIPSARDAVYAGQGDPGSAPARHSLTPCAQGGVTSGFRS